MNMIMRLVAIVAMSMSMAVPATAGPSGAKVRLSGVPAHRHGMSIGVSTYHLDSHRIFFRAVR